MVNIGVGGFDLGLLMVSYVLFDFKVNIFKLLKVYFVFIMDGS